jgi:uncharacterized protein YndB with AHSA1/START domain
MNEGPLRHEVRIDAPLETVHRYFTDPARLVRWWPSEATIDPRPRGGLRLQFVRPDGDVDVARGEFLELSARRIVFTWGFEGDTDLGPGGSRVEVTLEPDGAGTLVRLEHHGLPKARRAQHDHGWVFFLDRLRDVLRAEAHPS